jgi:hypothetical protein
LHSILPIEPSDTLISLRPIFISYSQAKKIKWAGHVERKRKSRGAYRVLLRKSEGTRPLGRTRRRREDNIKIDLREVKWEHRLD